MSESVVTLDRLVSLGKQTLESMYGVEGSGVFSPIFLAEYEDGNIEVTLLAGDLDSEGLADALVLISQKAPLRSLSLTVDSSLRGQNQDALIILSVTDDGPKTALAPYIIERTARRAIIVWDDIMHADSSDARLAGALQIALSSSRATMSE